MLLTIDPGAHTGWALFRGTSLQACGLTTPAKWSNMPGPPCDVLIEEPTLYRHGKARPADVMALQLKVGQLKGWLESVGCKVELVQPRTWKHSVPKPIHHARISKALTDAERRLAEGARGDTWDAIGLGLWKLKRMK